MFVRLVVFAHLLCSASLCHAHEYWIESIDQSWLVGDTVLAGVKNGEQFLGREYPFDPAVFSRGGLVSETKMQPLSGRLGDYPAIQIPLQEPGLNLIMLETSERQLEYANKTAFLEFLSYHGLSEIVEGPAVDVLLGHKIVERYFRFCKSLIEVHPAAVSKSVSKSAELSLSGRNENSALRRQQQGFEIVVLDNPFDSDVIRLQLVLEGKSLANRQLELFHRNKENAVVRKLSISNSEGIAEFDISEKGNYLINSVWVNAPSNPGDSWESLWASYTFNKIESAH